VESIKSSNSSLHQFLSELPSEQAESLLALEIEMQKNGKEKDAPVRDIMGLLGDKWSHLILLILHSGTLGHSQLKRSIELLSFEEAISQRVLTMKLRALERNGIVARTVSDDVPPRVDYSLTAIGGEVVEHTQALVKLIELKRPEIKSAREQFDTLD